jgi:hypothetical protein
LQMEGLVVAFGEMPEVAVVELKGRRLRLKS